MDSVHAAPSADSATNGCWSPDLSDAPTAASPPSQSTMSTTIRGGSRFVVNEAQSAGSTAVQTGCVSPFGPSPEAANPPDQTVTERIAEPSAPATAPSAHACPSDDVQV